MLGTSEDESLIQLLTRPLIQQLYSVETLVKLKIILPGSTKSPYRLLNEYVLSELGESNRNFVYVNDMLPSTVCMKFAISFSFEIQSRL